MKRSFSITRYFREKWNESQENKKNRIPKWYHYEIDENNYFPTQKELLKRITMNTLTFVMSVITIFAISLIGLKTVFFQTLNILASLLNNTEITWLAYGAILGIGGSLIFYNVADYKKSVHSIFITALFNIYYFAVFFIVLNLLVYLFAIIFGIWP